MEEYAKENKVTLGDEIDITIMDINYHYQISGIVTSKQPEHFASIFTYDNSNSIETSCYIDRPFIDNQAGIDMYTGASLTSITNQNPYGHKLYDNMAQYELKQGDTFLLIESAFGSIFILFIVSATSSKRHTQEFSLLRSIGATNKQLNILCLYESLLVTIFSIILGSILSLAISYEYMKIVESQIDAFVFSVDYLNIVLIGLLIFILSEITISMPMIRSSKRSLTGTFEGDTFRYIEIRFHELHYQRLWRLAYREIHVNKKLFFAFIFIVAIGSISICDYLGIYHKEKDIDYMYVTWDSGRDKEFYQFTLTEDQLPLLEHFNNFHFEVITENNTYYDASNTTIPVSDQDICYTDNIALLNDNFNFYDWEVKGKIPTANNEVIIQLDKVDVCPFENINSGIYNENTNNEESMLHQQFYIGNNQYEIVGVVSPIKTINLYQDYPDRSPWYINMHEYKMDQTIETVIYMLPDAFNQTLQEKDNVSYHVQVYYENEKQENYLEALCYNYIHIYQNQSRIQHMEIGNDRPEREDLKVTLDVNIVTLLFLICSILCYQINKNEMMNHINDYMLQRLNGMTKKDLCMKQIIKGIYLALLSTLFVYVYFLMDGGSINTIRFILVSLVVFFILSLIIYVTPLNNILRREIVDYIGRGR